MRQLEKILQKTQFMEKLERRWVNRIAPEIAEEIVVLLKNGDLYTCASQQIAEHHSCRATTDDATCCFDNFSSHACHLPSISCRLTSSSLRTKRSDHARMRILRSSLRFQAHVLLMLRDVVHPDYSGTHGKVGDL